ncbi:MAG: four helix bundle protein [Planctomycetes bacterium RBG_16_55_9]|jgi:four helix bundle protein|nr:MAG: four helix bundle protein [Planctomycetes bacterium RBG_16_55_9]
MLVKSYEELDVYKLAFELQQRIFEISKSFPSDEKYSLTDQIRRSSRAVGANIAEAWAKRRYIAHFVAKLTDSDGEQQETRHWLRTAYKCEYISQRIYKELSDQYSELGTKLGKMMANADKWCTKYPL